MHERQTLHVAAEIGLEKHLMATAVYCKLFINQL